MKKWVSLVDKIDILSSTLALMIHSRMRPAFLQMQVIQVREKRSEDKSHLKEESIHLFKKKQSVAECQTEDLEKIQQILPNEN